MTQHRGENEPFTNKTDPLRQLRLLCLQLRCEACASASVDWIPSAGQQDSTAGYSHSMVPGGLLVISNTQRFTPLTSLMMRLANFSSRS